MTTLPRVDMAAAVTQIIDDRPTVPLRVWSHEDAPELFVPRPSRTPTIRRTALSLAVGCAVAIPGLLLFGAMDTLVFAGVLAIAVVAVWTLAILVPGGRATASQIHACMDAIIRVAGDTNSRIVVIEGRHHTNSTKLEKNSARLAAAESHLQRLQSVATATLDALQNITTAIAAMPDNISAYGVDKRQEGIEATLGRLADEARRSQVDIECVTLTPDNVVPIDRAGLFRRAPDGDRRSTGH